MSDVPAEDFDDLLADFVDEGVESLRDLPTQLVEFRRQPGASGPINAVFRSVHSIKGGAGFLGLTGIKLFSHSLENTLDEVRQGKLELTEDLERAFVKGFDYLDEMLHTALEGTIQSDLAMRESDLLDQIAQLAAESGGGREPEDDLLDGVVQLAKELAETSDGASWSARLADLVETYRGTQSGEAQDEAAGEGQPRPPQSFSGKQFTLGSEDVTQDVTAVLELFLRTEREPYQKEWGAAFVATCNSLVQRAEAAGLAEVASAVTAATEDFVKIDNSPLDVDADVLAIVWEVLEPAIVSIASGGDTPDSDTPSKSAESSAKKDPAASQADAPHQGGSRGRMVRIKEERLDEFLNHVSGLFITGELLKDLHSRMTKTDQAASLLEELRQINRTFSVQSQELQQSVVALSRVSVSGLFSKFPRMARSLADQLGKKIDVHLSGEETEIDKTLVEELDSPLTHMIRNVVDHGIEPPDERRARGLPEAGNLWLHAEETRSHVRITIRDDGRGVDPRKLRAKVVEKGILSEAQAAALSDQEAVELVFHAGFSTAEKLSEVSGRGVGMDVVRTTLREHDGEVYVESQVGVGTTFTLEIPIRNAVIVIDGLMLRHAGQNFVVPFEHIREITEIVASELVPVHGSKVARIRGNTYDALSLGALLGLDSPDAPPADRWQAVLVGHKNDAVCLLVDQVFGHRQVVVNSLNQILPGQDKIAGVAQLGGGKLALVVSVPDIVKSLHLV